MILDREIVRRAMQFEARAHEIFGSFEASPSRVVHLSETFDAIEALAAEQEDMLKQAARCVELEVYRAAHVMAWAAVIDHLQQFLFADPKLIAEAQKKRPKWREWSIVEFREAHGERAFLDLCKETTLITKGMWNTLCGLLHRRNLCAHPTDYYPGLNESLGYISECVGALRNFQKRMQSR